MSLDDTMLQLRLIARKKGKYVMNKLFDDYLIGHFDKTITTSCLLCGSESNLTKEHVLPRWVFQNDPNLSFKTDVNQLSQKYIRTTVPMCLTCNTEILNILELHIQKVITKVDLENKYYSWEDWDNIIRWLETIDFKFQLMDITTKFKAHKKAGYHPFVADLSIAEMRHLSIRTVKSKARRSLKRISTKDKLKRENSLIVGVTKVKTFNYFHKSGEFIHLEVPKYNKAFFYFFDKEFEDEQEAKKEALDIISSAYGIE